MGAHATPFIQASKINKNSSGSALLNALQDSIKKNIKKLELESPRQLIAHLTLNQILARH